MHDAPAIADAAHNLDGEACEEFINACEAPAQAVPAPNPAGVTCQLMTVGALKEAISCCTDFKRTGVVLAWWLIHIEELLQDCITEGFARSPSPSWPHVA